MTHGTSRLTLTLTIDGVATDYIIRPRNAKPRAFEVKNTSNGKNYRVWESSKGSRCNCEDFRRNHADGGEGCKHVRALRAHLMVN